MNRNITNIIRSFMDEWLPPVIRDNKYLMYPLFWIWYKGKYVKKRMEFKSYFHELSKEDYKNLYSIQDSISHDRPTDLNYKSIQFIIENIGDDKRQKILDVGCGRGDFLRKLYDRGFINLYGCDLIDKFNLEGVKYIQADVEKLPFDDREFDIAVCSHTIEHVLNINKTIKELKRITKNKLIITVPCQKYFHYTFDLHIHFFPEKSYLIHTMGMKNYKCENKSGDLVFVGYIN